jgi:hypothetical protein
MAKVIRVRDVVRGDVVEFGPEEPALRGSYDLFGPGGPVRLHEGLAEWFVDEGVRTSRVASATLGDVHPGERVLVRVDAGDEWWLCDVEAIDGVEDNR